MVMVYSRVISVGSLLLEHPLLFAIVSHREHTLESLFAW